MSYIDKIVESVVIYKPVVDAPSETVPHQAFTPREILRQFVLNDVQVMQLKATDELYTFSEDVSEAQNSLVEFEDEFQARDYMRNVYKSKSAETTVRESPEETSPAETSPAETPPAENPPAESK